MNPFISIFPESPIYFIYIGSLMSFVSSRVAGFWFPWPIVSHNFRERDFRAYDPPWAWERQPSSHLGLEPAWFRILFVPTLVFRQSPWARRQNRDFWLARAEQSPRALQNGSSRQDRRFRTRIQDNQVS